MIIENSKMLAYFDALDKVRYYNMCTDIALAGDDYKVMEIVFFADHPDGPFSDYIQVKKYDDSFLLLGVDTQDTGLISECLAYVGEIKDAFDEIEIRTPYPSVLNHEGLNRQFSMEIPAYPASPVYYIHSPSELREIRHDPRVYVSRMREEDRIEIARDVKAGKLDAECMGEDCFRKMTCFQDMVCYVLRVDGDIAGYLRAECGYANIYDIGWLYVEERYRGNGYATELASWFSHDMFNSGAIPHYGFAISKESARVAEKCGYQCNRAQQLCRTLTAKKEMHVIPIGH